MLDLEEELDNFMAYRKSRFSSVSGLGRSSFGGGGGGSSIGINLSGLLGRTSAEYNPYAQGETGEVPIDPSALPPTLQKQFVDPATGQIDVEGIVGAPYFANTSNFFGRNVADEMNRELGFQEASGKLQGKQRIAEEKVIGEERTQQGIKEARAKSDISVGEAIKLFAINRYGKPLEEMNDEEAASFAQVPLSLIQEHLAKSKQGRTESELGTEKATTGREILSKTRPDDVAAGVAAASSGRAEAEAQQRFTQTPQFQANYPTAALSRMMQPYAAMNQPFTVGAGQTRYNPMNIPDLGMEPSAVTGGMYKTFPQFQHKVVDMNAGTMRTITDASELKPGEVILDSEKMGEGIMQTPSEQFKWDPVTGTKLRYKGPSNTTTPEGANMMGLPPFNFNGNPNYGGPPRDFSAGGSMNHTPDVEPPVGGSNPWMDYMRRAGNFMGQIPPIKLFTDQYR